MPEEQTPVAETPPQTPAATPPSEAARQVKPPHLKPAKPTAEEAQKAAEAKRGKWSWYFDGTVISILIFSALGFICSALTLFALKKEPARLATQPAWQQASADELSQAHVAATEAEAKAAKAADATKVAEAKLTEAEKARKAAEAEAAEAKKAQAEAEKSAREWEEYSNKIGQYADSLEEIAKEGE